MNLILALLIGLLTGWISFTFLRLNTQQGLRSSLFIGIVGGGIGMQLTQMLSPTPVTDAQLNVFALVVAGATAGACLVIANMIAGRRSRSI